MIHLNHIALATRNLYEAAFRLRAETGFGFYDGGFNPVGLGNKIFPLGDASYIQMQGIVDPFGLEDPARPALKRFYDAAAEGERFMGVNLRVDTAQELEAVAARHGLKAQLNGPGGRIGADGATMKLWSIAGELPPGMPPVYYFEAFNRHPSGQPVEPAPGLVRPGGVAWVEVGGTAADMARWLGAEAAGALPFRYVDRPPRAYAIGVRTEAGDVVVRR